MYSVQRGNDIRDIKDGKCFQKLHVVPRAQKREERDNSRQGYGHQMRDEIWALNDVAKKSVKRSKHSNGFGWKMGRGMTSASEFLGWKVRSSHVKFDISPGIFGRGFLKQRGVNKNGDNLHTSRENGQTCGIGAICVTRTYLLLYTLSGSSIFMLHFISSTYALKTVRYKESSFCHKQTSTY